MVHTKTYTFITPANPFLRCEVCGTRIERFRQPDGMYDPCNHKLGDYLDLCPSWGPVDDCRCNIKHEEPVL